MHRWRECYRSDRIPPSYNRKVGVLGRLVTKVCSRPRKDSNLQFRESPQEPSHRTPMRYMECASIQNRCLRQNQCVTNYTTGPRSIRVPTHVLAYYVRYQAGDLTHDQEGFRLAGYITSYRIIVVMWRCFPLTDLRSFVRTHLM